MCVCTQESKRIFIRRRRIGSKRSRTITSLFTVFVFCQPPTPAPAPLALTLPFAFHSSLFSKQKQKGKTKASAPSSCCFLDDSIRKVKDRWVMVAEQVGFATRPAVITSSKIKNRRHQNIEDEKNKRKPTNNEEIKKRIN